MKTSLKIIKWFLALLAVALVAAFVWLYVASPALLRVGAGYAAKIVCSNVFIAGRDPQEVLAVDVQAPGHPLLRFMRVEVDRDTGVVRAGLFGFLATNTAVYREGTGCATVANGDIEAARAFVIPPRPLVSSDDFWPMGDTIEPVIDAALSGVLDDADMTGPGMRAVVVAHRGRIIAERYGDGFSAETPLLGWSMTKTVTAAIIGTRIRDGWMDIETKNLFDVWAGDERREISVADLMAMSSGLAFNEDYGNVTDVTRMLFLEPDMAAFAADKPLSHRPGEYFSYSSGTTAMLSRLWQQSFEAPADALVWPGRELFEPLGMNSAVLEVDSSGTFAGSSYMYATARDWARFGQFLLEDGLWNGRRILPEGFVAWMREPAPASRGRYGRGQVWLPARDDGLPEDVFYLSGHDGQTVTVIPSRELVIVRLGLTPSKERYRVQRMIAAIVEAVQ